MCFIWCLLLFIYCEEISAQSFKSAADSIRRYRSVPGLAYAVFTSGSILEIGTSGTRMLKTKDSVRITDRFHLGTSTTLFTAYLAARMQELNKIRWNSSLIEILPELKGNSMKLYHPITLEQLLSQRAGILPYTEMDHYKGLEILPGSLHNQRKTFAAIVLQKRPLTLPDSSKPTYSIAGTSIAAFMLEKAGGKEWEQLIDQYINKTLSISIKFGLPNLRDSLQPSGHWDRYGSVTVEPATSWAKPIPAVMPATDINISIID